jgi:hypothetical protein
MNEASASQSGALNTFKEALELIKDSSKGKLKSSDSIWKIMRPGNNEENDLKDLALATKVFDEAIKASQSSPQDYIDFINKHLNSSPDTDFTEFLEFTDDPNEEQEAFTTYERKKLPHRPHILRISVLDTQYRDNTFGITYDTKSGKFGTFFDLDGRSGGPMIETPADLTDPMEIFLRMQGDLIANRYEDGND